MLHVTAVRTIPLRAPLNYPFWSATHVGLDPRLGPRANRPVLLIEVETSDGLVGLGQCQSSGRNLAALDTLVREELATYLLGQDAFARERIWETIYRGIFQHGRKGMAIAAMSGLGIALWDLAGKALGAPVYRLLGADRQTAEACGSADFYAENRGLPELQAEIEGLVEEGFRSVKMKIGCLWIEQDLERVRLVRETLPDGYGLYVDANRSYRPKTALRVAQELSDLDVLFLEEPTDPDDLDGAELVGAGSPIPIVGYETEYRRYGYRERICPPYAACA